MVFSSLLFLTLFLPVTIALYYALPEKAKNVLLLIVSLVFYAWGEPVYVFLMLITTLYIWCFGLLIEKYNEQKKNHSLAMDPKGHIMSGFLVKMYKMTDHITNTYRLLYLWVFQQQSFTFLV